jgi:hypothetical protein
MKWLYEASVTHLSAFRSFQLILSMWAFVKQDLKTWLPRIKLQKATLQADAGSK